jgi:FdhD protein
MPVVSGDAAGRGSASATVDVGVRKFSGAGARDERDRLAVEAPLEIRLGGRPIGVLLRTPGHDEELVAGFLVTEGIVAELSEVESIARPDDLEESERGFVIDVRVRPGLDRLPAARLFLASAACGACGKPSLAAFHLHAPRVVSDLVVSAELVGSLPDRLRAAQPVFDATGGLHAAGLFSAAGDLLAAREDVGRHNAVDKVIGWALRAGAPLGWSVLQVSGRLGYEIAQKAIVAGIPIVASVGAASSLAVDLAGRYGLTLATFARRGRFNVYGETSRVAAAAVESG